MGLHSHRLVSPLVALMQSQMEKTAVYIQNIHEDELLLKMKIVELHDGKAHIISDPTYIRIQTLVRQCGCAG